VGSRDSSVCIVTRLQTGQARNHLSIYYRSEISIGLHSFRNSLTYIKCGEPFASCKGAYCLLLYSGKIKKEWLYIGTLLYVYMTFNWKNIFYFLGTRFCKFYNTYQQYVAMNIYCIFSFPPSIPLAYNRIIFLIL